MDDSSLIARFSAINERLDRIEAQLAAVSERLGMPFALSSAGVPPEVVQLARANKQIEAIKRYREFTNCSLEEARQVVLSL